MTMAICTPRWAALTVCWAIKHDFFHADAALAGRGKTLARKFQHHAPIAADSKCYVSFGHKFLSTVIAAGRMSR